MGATISLKVHENLLKSIDDIASSLNLTRSEWIRSTLAHAIKMEIAQDKIMDFATTQYIDNKLTFDDMVKMVGFENSRRIDAAVKGVEKSMKEADSLAARIGRKKQ
jgi:metal-responsive CopG/Arc/MetJ family transcriptional regulator